MSFFFIPLPFETFYTFPLTPLLHIPNSQSINANLIEHTNLHATPKPSSITLKIISRMEPTTTILWHTRLTTDFSYLLRLTYILNISLIVKGKICLNMTIFVLGKINDNLETFIRFLPPPRPPSST